MSFAGCWRLIPFFFDFFHDINSYPLLQMAYQLIYGNKLLQDGYCDVSDASDKYC